MLVDPMELRQLRSFIAAADEGNISRAAQKLHLTQPALSRQIKALEESLGVSLLHREAHSFRLSKEGEILLTEARKLIERADQAIGKVQAAGSATTLRVGYAPSLAAGLLPTAMQAFTQRHRQARIELHDLSSAEMLAGLLDGSLDLAVMVRPGKVPAEVEWIPLQQHPLQVAMHHQHPMAEQTEIEPQELDGVRLLTLCRKGYPEAWSQLASWFKAEGIDAKVAGEYDGISSLITAAEAGLGLTLLAERSADLYPGRLTYRPLTRSPEPVCLTASFPVERQGDPILQVLVEELRRAAEGD